jgi:hypothetical protein
VFDIELTNGSVLQPSVATHHGTSIVLMDDGDSGEAPLCCVHEDLEAAYLSLAKLQKMQLKLGNSLFTILGHEHKESPAKDDQ